MTQWVAWLLFSLGICIAATLTYHELRMKKHKLEVQTAKLQLSVPIPVENPQTEFARMNDGSGQRLQFYLWRVILTNTQVNSKATDARVKLAESKPNLDFLKIDLHKKHNNHLPYKTLHDVVWGEEPQFDVIGKAIDSNDLFIFRSDAGNGDYVFQVDVDITEGLLLKIEAFSNPPSIRTEKWYRASINEDGRLDFKVYEDTKSRKGRFSIK